MTFLSLTELITKQASRINYFLCGLKITLKFYGFPHLQGTFYMYTGISAIALVVFYIILPETKGKTIEQMNQLFDKSNTSRQIER